MEKLAEQVHVISPKHLRIAMTRFVDKVKPDRGVKHEISIIPKGEHGETALRLVGKLLKERGFGTGTHLGESVILGINRIILKTRSNRTANAMDRNISELASALEKLGHKPKTRRV